MENHPFGALRRRGLCLLVLGSDGVIEGIGAYAPGLEPVAVAASGDEAEDARRLDRAIDAMPPAESLRRVKQKCS
jgi:hypothetical protein